MKVLIVDDEKHVRDAIKLLGEWERFGITDLFEAANGYEAIQQIKFNAPDIVLTDIKMPEMNGIDLLQWIFEEKKSIKTVLITGYNEYEYMRKAIQYKSSDYILKPIDPDTLNQTIDKVISSCKEELAQVESESFTIQKSERVQLKNIQFSKIISGENQNLNELIELGISIKSSTQVLVSTIHESMVKKLKQTTEDPLKLIIDRLNEDIMSSQMGCAFQNVYKFNEICIIFTGNKDVLIRRLTSFNESLKNSFDIELSFYCGGMLLNVKTLPQSYLQAVSAMQITNILDNSKVKFYQENQENSYTHPLNYKDDFEMAIKLCSVKKFQEIINSLVNPIRSGGFVNLKQVKIWEKEFEVIASFVDKKYRLSLPLNEIKSLDTFWNQFGEFQFNEYVSKRIQMGEMLINENQKLQYKSEMRTIHLVEEYIQQHYEREISLQEISDQFYVSREYISRKFKSEFGENLSEYLTKVRMEKAKKLLADSKLKIYEVAHIIGYQDDKYFRKLFKKTIGVTPNEYRKELK